MSIRDDLFPSKASADLVQTRWCKDWFDLAGGFGYAAEELTKQRATFHATIDQAGIAIFFLHRHRIELTLKGWLVELGTPDRREHDLTALLKKVEAAVKPRHPDAWHDFDRTHGEFIRIVASADERSFTFRYPEDKAGQPIERPEFIDLAVMREAVEAFYCAVAGFVDYETELADAARDELA